MRVAKPVQLSADDDRRLQALSKRKRKRIEARFQMCARGVLLAAAARCLMAGSLAARRCVTCAGLAGKHTLDAASRTVATPHKRGGYGSRCAASACFRSARASVIDAAAGTS